MPDHIYGHTLMGDSHTIIQEVIFSEKDLVNNGIHTFADFWEYGQRIEGGWEITFKIEENE